MLLKIVDEQAKTEGGAVFRDIFIHEGDMFLLPGGVPHNPVRFANTVGVVLEQGRPEKSIDRLRWYCPREGCAAVVHEAAFHCTNLGTQIKQAVGDFAADENKRTCPSCGVLARAAPEPMSIPDPNLL